METLIKYLLYKHRILANFDEAFYHAQMTHYASELIDKFNFTEQEFSTALQHASNTLKTAGIPIGNHMRKIYKIQNGISTYDFKLSPLAFALILLNGNTTTPNVAKLQIELINKLLQ
jgi:hypothetical protein